MICSPMAVRLAACILVPTTIASLVVLLAAGCSGHGAPTTGRDLDRRLREGHYGLALAGFRTVFGEPGLDLAARHFETRRPERAP